jgi:hypothetical protein
MEPNSSSYKPFLIGQGVSKTGLFTYLQSWVKPEDAYDELLNAYVYRGSLYQRPGTSLFPSASGAGALVYQDNVIAATGSGGTGPYNGVLSNIPLIGTVTITAQTAAGKRSSTADFASGNVNWSTGGASLASSGTINFSTGVWSITTSSAVAANIPIVIQYNYVPTSLTTPINNPIMGIVLHQDQTQNTQKLFVADTRRASRWNPTPQSFVPIQSFQQIIWAGNGDGTTSTTALLPLRWTNIAPYSVSVSAVFAGITRTITDVPTSSTAGGFTTDTELNSAANSAIDYANGTVTITWTAPLPVGSYVTITASLQGDYFSGDNTNFFKFTNWQTVDSQPSYLYMTNNIDYVTLFDGTYLSRPPFAITLANTVTSGGAVLFPKANDFQTCLDIKVYKNRLMFIRPTLLSQTPDAQSIRWSQLANVAAPRGQFNFVANVAGNGGELSAPTGDWIQCAEFLRDILTVFFQNSTWVFRFTGNTKDLFRFDKISGAKSTSAPYGSVEYDDRTTSMGAKGLIQCDGVSVARYDEAIIDYVQNINQNFFKQCYAQRFDNFNHTWMLFPTQENENTTSNQALIYNFLENTWALFSHSLGYLVQTPTELNTLSCLGLGSTVADLTWDDFAVGSAFFSGQGQTWSQATYGWNSFQNQDLAPNLLGGDQNGFVYTMMDGSTDNPGPATSNQANGVPTRVLTKRLNPFIANGVKARFGYLDVYYEVNADVKATFKFYLNNSSDASISFLMTFDGQEDNAYAWKRIYISAVAEFIQIEINSIIGIDEDTGEEILNTAGPFKILGMILYAGPAGRLTPGKFL